MFQFSEIAQVHLELSTLCNAACPQCGRTEVVGSANDNLPRTSLSLQNVEKILPSDFIAQLNSVYACGNYGDPALAPDCLEVFRYLRSSKKELDLQLHTNGSIHEQAWWHELAGIIGAHGSVHFAIDGLADTHAVYRVGTRYEKVLANARAFIEAGGAAYWRFIVFRHNEHQLEEAEKISRELGFASFVTIKTGRFDFEWQPQLKRMERLGGDIRKIAPPKDSTLRVANSPVELGQKKKRAEWLRSRKIVCQARRDRKIYISAEGTVLPCCYLGQLYDVAEFDRNQIRGLIEQHGGLAMFDARSRPLRDIIDSDFFQNSVPQGWQQRDVAEGRLIKCSKVCGVDQPVKKTAKYTGPAVSV